MKLNEAIKEVSVAVDMHDTDKANEGWKVIKSNLNNVYDEVEQALQEELTFHLGKVDYDTLNMIKTGVLRRIKRWLEK